MPFRLHLTRISFTNHLPPQSRRGKSRGLPEYSTARRHIVDFREALSTGARARAHTYYIVYVCIKAQRIKMISLKSDCYGFINFPFPLAPTSPRFVRFDTPRDLGCSSIIYIYSDTRDTVRPTCPCVREAYT